MPRSKKFLRLVLVLSGALVLALVLLACGYSTVTSVPTNPAAIAKATATGAAGTAAQKLNQINAAEQRWKNKNINSYRIVIRHYQSYFSRGLYTVTRKNGQVTDKSASCLPTEIRDTCNYSITFDPDSFTIPGLFSAARNSVQSEQAAIQYQDKFSITFDQTYSFPRFMEYRIVRVTDSDKLWDVQDFEVLK